MRHLRLLVWFLALCLVGCDGSSSGSSDNFWQDSSGGSNTPTVPTVATGSVAFSFVRAQSVLEVPNGTQTLRFVFTDRADGEGRLLLEASKPYAASITITGVPVTARSVRVTALSANGTSLFTALASLAVQQGQTSTVNFPTFEQVVPTELLLDPTEVELRVGGERQLLAWIRLSDGSTQPATSVEWSQSGSSVLVDANGKVTAVSAGTSTVTARVGSLTGEAQVLVLPALPETPGTVTLESFTLSRNSFTFEVGTTLQVVATGTFSNSTVRQLSQVQDGLTFQSSNTAVASVDDEGRIVGLAVGSTTITAQVGAQTQQATVTVTESQPLAGPVIAPQSLIATHTLGAGPYPLAPDVTITDSHSDLGGGELEIRNYGIVALLHTPSGPNIGSVTGDGTNTITVSLDAGVSPALVAQFLRGVTLSYTGQQGSTYTEITLNNGHGQTGYGYVQLEIRSADVLALTVNPSLAQDGTNFHDLQPAIERVEGYGADGSVITMVAGDFRVSGNDQGNYVCYYHDGPDFTIRGNNAGVPVGIQPQTRGAETVLASVNLDAQSEARVTFDGLTFDPNKTNSTDGPVGINAFTRIISARNCIFGSSFQDMGISAWAHYGAICLIEDCRFENINYGVGLYDGGAEIRRSVFRSTRHGLYFGSSFNGLPTIVENNLFENSTDMHLDTYLQRSSATRVNNNAFLGSGVVALDRFGSTSNYSLDARNNWWGQASGPLPSQLLNNSTLAEILVTPFLTTNPIP